MKTDYTSSDSEEAFALTELINSRDYRAAAGKLRILWYSWLPPYILLQKILHNSYDELFQIGNDANSPTRVSLGITQQPALFWRHFFPPPSHYCSDQHLHIITYSCGALGPRGCYMPATILPWAERQVLCKELLASTWSRTRPLTGKHFFFFNYFWPYFIIIPFCISFPNGRNNKFWRWLDILSLRKMCLPLKKRTHIQVFMYNCSSLTLYPITFKQQI